MQTLECGQCFRYTKIKEHKYLIVAKHRLLEIEQTSDSIILYNTSLSDYNQIWKDYFDINTDYSEIKNYLIKKDSKMKDIIKNGAGIRILNQDFVEILISFIISQNKQIPQIKQVVENLCTRYGDFLEEYKGVKYYDFPSVQILSTLSEEDFRECKAGFRAKYLVDACSKLADGTIKEDDFATLDSSEIRDELCTIKGVGVKVSNCVLLYGLRQKEAFPIDVWIKRIMENIYFKEETKIEQIQKFADELFGKYGGYAQQYLFYYSRS
jgi:N-glycosylase/DNA lyase